MKTWQREIGFLALLASPLLAAGCGGAYADTGAAKEEVVLGLAAEDVTTAKLGRVEEGVTVTGPLDPYRVVQVRAQLPGSIERVGVEQGDVVAAGRVLARYDATTLETRVAGAVAAVAAAEAGRASAEHAEASARLLAAAGAISEQDLRRAHGAAEAARAQVAAARAQLREAEEALARAVVRAPAGGVVSQRAVNPGEAVNPGQLLFTVVDVDTLELAGKIAADQLRHVRVGGAVVFEMDAYPGHRFEGRVARIEPVADAATRQVTVYVRLPNPEHRLVGGLYATGLLVTRSEEEVVTIPPDALREDTSGTYVLAVEEGVLVRRDVRTGAVDRASEHVAVLQGLAAGTVLLVGPPTDVPPGTPVRIGQPGAATGEDRS